MGVVSTFIAENERLWVDEVITVSIIQRMGYWKILTTVPINQPHLPTYYLFLETVGPWLGHIASIVALPVTAILTVWTGYELFEDRFRAHIAGVFVATSPFLARQATWLRMYSILIAIMTVGLYLGIKSEYRQSAIAFTVAAFVHPFALLGMGWLLLVSWLDTGRIKIKFRWLILSVIPTVTLVLVKLLFDGNESAPTDVTHGTVPGIIKTVLLPMTALLGSKYLFSQAVLAVVLFGLLLHPLPDKRLVLYIAVPIIGIIGATVIIHPVFRPKYFGMIAPAVALVAVQKRELPYQEWYIGMLFAVLYASMWLWTGSGSIVTRYYQFYF